MEPYQQLEVNIGKWMGYPPENVVVCSSGTAALHLALEAMALPPGSEVIVPDFTMVACARAVTLAGLTPVFVDCDDRLLMDGETLFRGYNCSPSKPAALMLVHVYGRQSDIEISGVPVIEDLAEAHGVKPHKYTSAACWSFYRNKIVAGEEGGAIAFKDPNAAGLARCLRSLGFTEAHDFNHIPRGHNYRMSNAHAKPILRSLDAFAGNHAVIYQSGDIGVSLSEARREIEGWYETYCPPEYRLSPRDAVWVYDLRIPWLLPSQQSRIVSALKAVGIQARHGFKPMHLQEEYRHCRVIGGDAAEKAAREVIYLPVVPGYTTQESCRKAFEVIKSTLG